MSTMNGLRVYINPTATGTTPAPDAFYSRRGNGPIYRWLYEEKLTHWRASRMHASDFKPHELSVASWKSVPEKLQAQLGEHYIE